MAFCDKRLCFTEPQLVYLEAWQGRPQLAPPLSIFFYVLIFDLMINIARLQMAASNTYPSLLRCQVVLNKRLLSKIVLLLIIWVFEVCHNLSCWVLSQFVLWNFFTIYGICQTLSWILSQFKFFSFVTIQVFEFCYHSFFL